MNIKSISALTAVAMLAVGAAIASEPPASPLPQSVLARVVFLGDSVTDGFTYPQLVRDSLAKSSGIKMVAINGGAGGDTMPKMEARLHDDVLDYHPTLVTIGAGDNDASRGETAQVYEASMRAAVDVLQRHHIEVILLTPVWQPKTKSLTDTYEAAIRQIAADDRLRVAEVTKDMIQGEAAGIREHSLDNHHPGYAGQHTIARAILDAMGYPDVPVVDRVNAVLDTDVIRDWVVRPVAQGEAPLTDAAVAALSTDATWKTVHAPFDRIDLSGSDWDSMGWLDDFRQEGMATQLDKNVAPGNAFISIATINQSRDENVYLQTGGDTNSVWLNGIKVFTQNGTVYHGWHPGRDAIGVTLKKGVNKIVALSGENLWVRIAPQRLWQNDQPAGS